MWMSSRVPDGIEAADGRDDMRAYISDALIELARLAVRHGDRDLAIRIREISTDHLRGAEDQD